MAEAVVDVERLKLGPTKLWTGLVLHHKDVFVSHVIPKLNETDRWFFSEVNRESRGVLEYAGVNVSKLCWNVHECSSISTLEVVWNNFPWGERDKSGRVTDQAWFCWQVSTTSKLELLKWAREVKQCEWDERTIVEAACFGNLEILKYCFSNGCPCDEEKSCKQAAARGHLDCVATATRFGKLDCLKYLVEEARVPLDNCRYVAFARYYEQPECENYLLEKGFSEPTDEEYAAFVEEEPHHHQ